MLSCVRINGIHPETSSPKQNIECCQQRKRLEPGWGQSVGPIGHVRENYKILSGGEKGEARGLHSRGVLLVAQTNAHERVK